MSPIECCRHMGRASRGKYSLSRLAASTGIDCNHHACAGSCNKWLCCAASCFRNPAAPKSLHYAVCMNVQPACWLHGCSAGLQVQPVLCVTGRASALACTWLFLPLCNDVMQYFS